MSFFSKTRIKAAELFNDSFEYLQKTYAQSFEVFTPASPFGQVLTVLANLGELIFFYIEAVATELNIARARNIESIYGLSRLTGHDPTRGISARGIIGLRLNTSAASQISGNYVQINNYAKLEISQNGLPYFIRFDTDFIKLEKSNPEFVNVELIQGELDTQTFTGTGFDLQSFNIITKESTDHDFVTVTVDGYRYELVDSLYDMDPGIKAAMVKTSITGGLTVFFGNTQFGYPPPLGSIIEIKYLKTRGSLGNLEGKTLDIKFIDTGIDTYGQDVDLNTYLALNITRMPNFGSNSEDPDFTRLIAPYMSRSFVLANPSNYIYYLRKYSYFSFINAYNTKDDMYLNDDNIIYLFLIPDIRKKLTTNKDYFDVALSEFTLTTDEKTQVINILNKSGRQVITAEVRIDDPVVKKYVLNIVLRFFDNVNKDAIRNNVRTVLNDYFLNVNRRDRIPRSDLIAIVEGVEGVDSVNIFFLSEKNETAISQGYYEVPVYGISPVTQQKTLIQMKQVPLAAGEDPQLGLDAFGDIIIGNEELALIRGGWTDRNGNYYEETPNANAMSSLNIFFKEEIPYTVYTASQQAAFNTLKRNKGTTIATSQNSKSTNAGRLSSTPVNTTIPKV
jgi:hypothetical protein